MTIRLAGAALALVGLLLCAVLGPLIAGPAVPFFLRLVGPSLDMFVMLWIVFVGLILDVLAIVCGARLVVRGRA